MQTLKASLLYASRNELGEGPFWHRASGRIFWVDILGKKVCSYEWHTGAVKIFDVDRRPSLIVESVNSRLVLAVQGGLTWMDPADGSMQWMMDLEEDKPNNRCNDGACDAEGRLWIGTMDIYFARGAGALYCIDKNLQSTIKLKGVTISNGITWSTDNSKMYYIDSVTGKILEFQFDLSGSHISAERTAIEIPSSWGQPDGMAIDEEGMLWVAVWGGFGVYRFDPSTGICLSKIELPVPQVSSCAFVGDRLDRLAITTARENMKEEDLARYPESGSLFIADPAVRGVEKYKFGAK